jgi:hypothetical protein
VNYSFLHILIFLFDEDKYNMIFTYQPKILKTIGSQSFKSLSSYVFTRVCECAIFQMKQNVASGLDGFANRTAPSSSRGSRLCRNCHLFASRLFDGLGLTSHQPALRRKLCEACALYQHWTNTSASVLPIAATPLHGLLDHRAI